MSDSDAAAIIAALEAETAAWQRRDLAALAEHWVQAPESRLITTFAGFGTVIVEGWEAIRVRYRAWPNALRSRTRRSRTCAGTTSTSSFRGTWPGSATISSRPATTTLSCRAGSSTS